MAKLTITEAYNDDKKRDGSQILDNRGRQKYRSRIKTSEKGEAFLTGFVYKPLMAGQVIEADVIQEEYNGQPQLRFTLKQTPQEKIQSTNTGEVLTEMKTHTVFLRQILGTLEDIRIALATHKTIESMKKPEPAKDPLDTFDENIGELPTDAMPVLDEDDFGNPFA